MRTTPPSVIIRVIFPRRREKTTFSNDFLVFFRFEPATIDAIDLFQRGPFFSLSLIMSVAPPKIGAKSTRFLKFSKNFYFFCAAVKFRSSTRFNF